MPAMRHRFLRLFFFLALPVFLLTSCAGAGYRLLASALTGAGSSDLFTGDDDPRLIADALPLVLKIHEMLSRNLPRDAKIAEATGRLFVTYAHAFVVAKAEELPEDRPEEKEKQLRRAKKLYRRGTEYLLKSFEIKYPGFKEKLFGSEQDQLLRQFQKKDVSGLYWLAAGWLAQLSTDSLDTNLLLNLYIPAALLYRALELDEKYEEGAPDTLLVTLSTSLPAGILFRVEEKFPSLRSYITRLYGDKKLSPAEKAKYHFKRALALSSRERPGLYTAYARSIAVYEGDRKSFREMLRKALSLDPAVPKEKTLENTIEQEQAEQLLRRESDYFLPEQ